MKEGRAFLNEIRVKGELALVWDSDPCDDWTEAMIGQDPIGISQLTDEPLQAYKSEFYPGSFRVVIPSYQKSLYHLVYEEDRVCLPPLNSSSNY
jgi:hypothetical protein